MSTKSKLLAMTENLQLPPETVPRGADDRRVVERGR